MFCSTTFIKYKEYLKDLFLLSLPIMIGNLGQMLIGATDVFVASKHGVETLASISIANSILFCISIIGIGLMAGISIVLSNIRGQNKPTKKYFLTSVQYSFWLAVILSLISFALIPLVDFMGFEARIVPHIKEYMFICSFSFFGMYIYQSTKEFLQAHEIVNFPNWILVIGVLVNAFFDYALVFGFGFIPSLGVKGLAIATLSVRTLMGLVMLLYCAKLFKYKSTFDFNFCKQIMKMGYPIGFALLLEFLGFNIITLIIGKESSVLAATHNIIITIVSLNFMIPLSMSNSIAIKVGYCNGARNLTDMKIYTVVGTAISTLYMGICSLGLFFFPKQLINVFTNEPAIISVGIPILFIASLFEMVDGYQVSLSGALKGLKMTRTVSICVIAGYWLFGLPFGFLLANKYGYSLMGYWIGLSISFFTIGIVQQLIIMRKFKQLKQEGYA